MDSRRSPRVAHMYVHWSLYVCLFTYLFGVIRIFTRKESCQCVLIHTKGNSIQKRRRKVRKNILELVAGLCFLRLGSMYGDYICLVKIFSPSNQSSLELLVRKFDPMRKPAQRRSYKCSERRPDSTPSILCEK